MKYNFLSILFLLTFLLTITSLVSAQMLEENIYTVDKCDLLYINVSASLPINDTEYYIKDCTETSTNYWSCNCYDDYDIILQYKINTINNYTLSIESKVAQYRSSSGGSSHRYYKIIEDNNTIENSTNISLSDSNKTNINISDENSDDNINITETKETQEETNKEVVNVIINDNETELGNDARKNKLTTMIGLVLIGIGLLILLVFIKINWRKTQ